MHSAYVSTAQRTASSTPATNLGMDAALMDGEGEGTSETRQLGSSQDPDCPIPCSTQVQAGAGATSLTAQAEGLYIPSKPSIQ